MRWPPALILGGLALGLLAGCAYYNGLYNANRLVKDAEKAEREGRVGEARSFWSQAAVKAESVVARYPDSKYRGDALLLRGRALRAAGDCAEAIDPLDAALNTSPDTFIVRQSRLLLGQCYYQVGDYTNAVATLTPFAESNDMSVAVTALFWRGQANLALEEYAAAARDLAACGLPQANLPLALAYIHVGQPQQAERVLLNSQSGRYNEHAWLAILDNLGAAYPEVASVVTDRLAQRPDLTSGEGGRLLLADGERWLAGNEPGRAAARFEQAAVTAPDSAVARAALVQLIKAELRLSSEVTRLPSLLDSLAAVSLDEDRAGELRYTELMTDLELAVVGLNATAGGVAPGDLTSRATDLDLFLAAEALRDSWAAVALAAAVFREIPRRFPQSAIAPKAILAAVWLDPMRADSLLGVLYHDYPQSPYTLVLNGEGDAEYMALEDSLRTLLNSRQLPTSSHR